MDDFEDSYKQAIEAGQRNLQAISRLRNWCFHAEIARSGGRGLIEAETGLPIGHMGVGCKYSKKYSMHSWLLEDAIYDFYQNNCKGCSERLAVGIPNIMEFVEPREKAIEERKKAREEETEKLAQKFCKRRQERAELRHNLSLEETFVLDLLDELDQEGIARDDPRLEQLANLAPETFTRKIVQHLLPAVLNESLPYSIPAAKSLLNAPIVQEEKLSVAVRLITSYHKSPTAIEIVISNIEKLSQSDLRNILPHFVSMALGPPPGMHIGIHKPIKLDPKPIQSLYQSIGDKIHAEVDALLSDSSPAKIGASIEIILACNSDELLSRHIRSIFTKLMRRRVLLPGERRDSRVLHYLRQAASKCLERFPEKTDKVIQSYLADNDQTGRKEANRAYSSMLKSDYRQNLKIGPAQRIAFNRLLWSSVEDFGDNMDDARQFFSNYSDEFTQLSVENFDELIGAAATLSEKYEQIDAEPILELAETFLSQIEKNNKRFAIDSLQKSLVEWAAVGAKAKGQEGIEDFISLYRKLPKAQTRMRGNMIVHVSKLLTGIESLKLVLSDWYGAFMDESAFVRASAVQSWEYVPSALVKNFPNLFFEAFSVLLTDPYVIVHQSAVQSLRRRSFPNEKQSIIMPGLWNLILHYSQKDKHDEFVVDCIETFSMQCLSLKERKGELGQVLSDILLRMEGSVLYRAIDHLHYNFKEVPGFVKVALKSIQDDYTRDISIDDCVSAILVAPRNELQDCIEDIKNAFEALKPFRPEGFFEALLYAAALSKTGDFSALSTCFENLIASIPKEDRYKQWQLEAELVLTASRIEHAIGNGEPFFDLTEKWTNLMSDLEKEYEERAKLRDFPPSFFLED